MSNRLKRAGKLLSRARAVVREFVRWWLRHDRQYRLKWRLANAAAALLMISSVALPILQANFTNRRYQLNSDTLKLVGKNNQALADKLKYNAQDKTYEFNKDAIKEYNPLEAVSQQVGGGGKDTKSLYALDVPEDFSKGVTYHDVNSQLSFSVVPQFDSLTGKTEQGRIVFPLDGGPQAIYTLKNNGLKEDIVVAGNNQDTLRFTYKLDLPKSLEAKPLPDGGIGIYSGDPSLFSNMSYGSDKDRQLVEKARENAEKTNLVFGIPAPTLTAKDGKQASATTRFELTGNTLTVVAEDLNSVQGTFSIDPSVVITSTSDFGTNGNNEGNIDFGTADQISRSGLTGATLGSWGAANTGATFSARESVTLVASNGYLYAIGGKIGTGAGGDSTEVQYAAINSSNGTVGAWASANIGSSFNVARFMMNAFAYNGKMYVIGGGGTSNVARGDVQFASICDGTSTSNGCSAGGGNIGKLGTWKCGDGSALPVPSTTECTTGRLPVDVALAQTTVYNGWVYVVGGCSGTNGPLSCGTIGSNTQQITQRAQVNADGTLGTWSNLVGEQLPATRFGGGAVAFNNRLYVIGGCYNRNLSQCNTNIGSNTWDNQVQYTTINADGSLSGTWTTSANTVNNIPVQNYRYVQASVYNGYIYYTVGSAAGSPDYTEYSQISTDGSIGPWNTTTQLTAGRNNPGRITYNGYSYIVAGCTAGTCTTQTNDVQVAKIDTPGTISSFTADNDSILASPNGVFSGATAIYNGYMYILGGNNGTGWTNEVRFAQLNSDGSTGAWSLTSAFAVARSNPAATAYNGYLYVAGGQAPGGVTTDCVVSGASIVYCRDIQKALINSDGTVGTWVSAGGYYAGAGNPGRDGLGMAAYNGYMYVAGGNYNQNSSVSTEVDIAPINSDGTVGTWVQNTTALGATGRSNFQLAQYGKYLYIAGGRLSGNNTDNSVIYTSLSSGGGMSAWGSAGSNFTTVRAYNFAAAYDGYLYITGGDNATTGNVGKSDVQYAKIDVTTGALSGSWTTSPVVLPTARSLTQGGMYNGYLYVAGGCSNLALFGGCNTLQRDVEYAQVNNGGSGMPTLSSESIASGTGRGAFGTAVYNGYMYRVGGCSTVLFTNVNTCGAAIKDDVNYAQISSSGSIGTWQTTTALSTGSGVTGRFGLAAAAYNGRLYAIGGCSATTNGNCTSFKSDVQYIDINTNGSLGASWSVAANTFTNGRYGLSAAVNNGYLYILGGCSAMSSDTCTTTKSDVQVSQLDATTGLPGTWGSAGSDFTTGRFYQSALIYNNTLYVLGGCTAMVSVNCTGFQNDVQYRALNTGTGALAGGSWSSTNSFHVPRYGSAVAASNGYLYLIGGCSANGTGNCTGYRGDIQYAPINVTGDVGDWNSMQALGTTRLLHGAAIVNNTLVVVGGNMPTNSFGTAQQSATLSVQPRIAMYSKLIELSRSTNVRSITYNGTLGTVSFSYRYAGSTGVFNSTANASGIAPTGTCTGNVQQARYLQVIATIDDTAAASYGETSGSTLTDFTVNYYYTHPAPQIRLRGGKTLQTGEQTPLDTCGSMAP